MIKDSFRALKDKSNWKYIGAFFAAYIIYLILYFVIFFGIPSLFSKIFSLTNIIILTISFIFVLAILFNLVLAFLSVIVMLKALRSFGLDTAPFGIGKFIRIIILFIASAMAACLCLFDLFFLLLIPLIIVLALIVIFVDIAIIKWIAILLAAIFAIIYLIAVIYNSLRLFLSTPIFLSKDIGIIDSIRESWRITRGNVISIIIALILIWLIVMVLSGALFLIIFIPGLIIVAIIALAAFFVMPILAALVFFLFYIIFLSLGLVFSSCLYVVEIFYVIAIYCSILGKGTAPKPLVQKPKPQPQTRSLRRAESAKRAEQRKQVWERKDFSAG